MFDDHHAVTAVDQSVQHADQFFDVGHVQTHGRLVQHVQGMGRLLATARDVVAHLGQLGHQLDALRLAAAECGRRLAQRQITQPHILEQLQRVADIGHGGEEVDRLVHLHLQHVANILAPPGDGQRLGVEAGTAAGFAQDLHIRQETHGHGADTLAFTAGATAVAGVETEAVGRVAARTGFQRIGKELADRVPETDIGRRAAARCLANRRLVDLQHPVHNLETGDAITAGPGDLFACSQRVTPGLGAASCDCRLDICQEHIPRQRGLAGATDAGDSDQSCERDRHVDPMQVMQRRVAYVQPGPRRLHCRVRVCITARRIGVRFQFHPTFLRPGHLAC